MVVILKEHPALLAYSDLLEVKDKVKESSMSPVDLQASMTQMQARPLVPQGFTDSPEQGVCALRDCLTHPQT